MSNEPLPRPGFAFNPLSIQSSFPSFVPPAAATISNLGTPSIKETPTSPWTVAPSPQSPVLPIKSLQTALEQARGVLKGGTVKAPNVLQLLQRVRSAAKGIFGENAPITQHLSNELKVVGKELATKADFREILETRLVHAERLFEQLTVLSNSGITGSSSYPSAIPSTKKIFIVHGHDELNWHRLSRLLSEAPYKGHGIEPVVIREQAGQSKSILQKFEDAAAESSYAIAIFTPDDIVRVQQNGAQYCQARPNVVFEMLC